MLISFEVGNHRSIADPQQLSFAAGQARQLRQQVIDIDAPATPRLTRVQGLFGDNGTGKSNFLSALSTLQRLVLQSLSSTEAEFAALYTPHRATPWLNQPTSFTADVLIEGIRYSYSVAFTARHITFEQLLVYRAGRAQRWFQRERGPDGREQWEPFSAALRGQREVWRQATRERALFLSTAAQLNAIDLTPLTLWFQEKLLVVHSAQTHLENVMVLMQEPDFKATVLGTIQKWIPDVVDFRIVWREVGAGSRHPRLEAQLCYEDPRAGRTWVSSEHESSGRPQLCILTSLIVDALNERQFLCIDDFDCALHPASARRLIRLITENQEAGPEVTQLLFTSRTPALLDVESIRRDEMNLMEKGPYTPSVLRSFGDDLELRQLAHPSADYDRGTVPPALL